MKKRDKQNNPSPISLSERSLREVRALIGDRVVESIEEANEFLNENFNGRRVGDIPAATPEDRAQNLVFDAWDAIDKEEARELVDEALEVDPGCPDALTHLATLTEDVNIARRLLEEAMASAEDRLGFGFFEENAGHFWGILTTRPYMRARFGLAQMLWDTGEEDAAIAHAWELIRLNPTDNQGVREVLAGWLLYKGRSGEAARLLRQFESDPTAVMAWARALRLFQAFGLTEAAEDALADALDTNEAVAAYLTGVRPWPDEVPSRYAIGGDEEAVITAFFLGEAWAATPGSIEWLVEFTAEWLGIDDDDGQQLPRFN